MPLRNFYNYYMRKETLHIINNWFAANRAKTCFTFLVSKSGIGILFLTLLFVTINSSATSLNFYNYKIHEDSWVSISGSTNINSFQCTSINNILQGNLVVSRSPLTGSLIFTDAIMQLNIVGFDCKNRQMSRDMHEAMGAEKNPIIEIKLISAEKDSKNQSSSNFGKIRAKIAITLNGITKETTIFVNWHNVDNYHYVLNGSKEISMKDFQIDPPSKAFGMVKVCENITINFNLVIQTSLISQN
jgi:hypothetical protein